MRKKLFFIFAIAFGIFFTISVVQKMWSIYRASGRLSRERAIVQQLEKENTDLQNKIKQAKSRDFIEKEARDKLNLAKPGETVLVLPQVASTQTATITYANDVPNWQAWWKLFFD